MGQKGRRLFFAGMTEPELGTAEDFKIDMHVVRSQTNDHPSFAAVRKTPFLRHLYMKRSFCQDRLRTNIGKTQEQRRFSQGEFAIGDDIMAGMCLVKVEKNGAAMLDYPKKRKPMETAQAIFEKEVKSQGTSLIAMEQKLVTLKEQAHSSSRNLMSTYSTEDVGAVHDIVRTLRKYIAGAFVRCHFIAKTESLPRQARDKHRENTQNKRRFLIYIYI
eukprot:COSAG06_NODE_5138_length_3687_cov_4.373467_2_plen_217_part_00